MTKAGLDPSRIQERAEMLAKVQGAKRKRNADEDEDVEMDEDEDEDEDEDANESNKGMDVDDDDESSPAKRVKTNSGGVISKRAPRSNRQAAGMRDEGVSWFLELHLLLRKLSCYCLIFYQQFTRATKLRNLGQRPRNMLAKAGEGDRVIRTKMVRISFSLIFFKVIGFSHIIIPLSFPSQNIYSLANAKAERHKEDDCTCTSIFVFFFYIAVFSLQ